MGRYSSDSEEEKKKRKKKKKKRSRSRSDSIESHHSSKPKKSKKKKKRKSRSRSRSPDRHRRSRSKSYGARSRSRSRSYSRRSRSRSYDSKDRYRRRSRSRSRNRYSRSRSRDRKRRSRTPHSRSHDSYSRSSRRSRSPSPGRKSRKNKSPEREDPCLEIPGFKDMTPAEQARIRMHMALKAAAAADEKIKGDISRNQSSTSLQDSLIFSQAVQDIEASGFSSTAFRSNRAEKKDDKPVKEEFIFGTAGELKLDSNKKPVLVDVDKEDLAHPSLYTDPEEKLDKWIQKLAALRRKKLEGEALT